MRVALLMSGGIRQSWLTAPSIYRNVVEPNNADIFLYVKENSMEPTAGLDTEAIVKTVFPTNVKGMAFTDDAYRKEVEQLIKSNYDKIDSQYREMGRDTWDKQLNHHNTDQYLQLKKCAEMAVKYASDNNFKYDIIARCRPDIGWLNRFELQRAVPADTIYVNHSMHQVVYKDYHWVEDTCVFGGQDAVLKLWSDFSDKMADSLEICDASYDLTCATEKLLARVITNSGIKYEPINEYYGHGGPDWIRPKLGKHWVDWSKSPNYHLVQKFGANGLAVYFDRIGQQNVVMDPTIIP